MTTRFIKAATVLACAVFSTLALAEPPARVGRVSLSQGQVGISGEAGDQASAAQVNWPVTSHNVITTGHGGRTEIRIGSTSIRLDADSSLEVSELDDDSLRLRLNYGSVNLRIPTAEALAGFELSTSNGRVLLREPGRVRVDAERVEGTSVVNVFDGTAVVEDRGTQLVVRAGRRAELRNDDVLTGQATRDSFDDWSQQRDQYDDRSTSARYVTSDMTGYEDLDRNGTWRDDPEYGPLWLPTAVAAGWAPYRDGSWTWIAPWGWTWVDNAPWGYAPFHYGRWVQTSGRWAWAPGRHVDHPVWAPALVGWVGGGTWNQNFGAGGRRPAQGWYPLTPRDAFVPGYRLSPQHLQHINRDARPDWREDGRGREGRDRDARNDRPREGLTVVPHEQFGHRGTISVRNTPHAVVPPLALQNAPAAAPSAPPGAGHERDGRGGDRFDRDFNDRNRPHRPELTGAPAAGQQPPGRPAPLAGAAAAPAAAPVPSPFTRRDGRPGFDDGRRQQYQQQAQPAATPAQLTAPTVPAAPAQPGLNRPDFRRDNRPDFEDRRQRQPPPATLAAPPVTGREQAAPPAAPPPPAMLRHAPQSAPAMAPVPPPAAAPAPPPPPMLRHSPQPAPAMPPAPPPAAAPAPAPPPAMLRHAPQPAPAPAPPPPPAAAPPPAAMRHAPQPAPQQASAEPAHHAQRADQKRGEERER
jgi:hypothetical protein